MDNSFNYPSNKNKLDYHTKHNNRNNHRTDLSSFSDDENNHKISFSCAYFCSLTGLLRLAIIICQLGVAIATVLVPKFIIGQIYLPPEVSATRDANLFFSISGFFLAIFIFLLYCFQVVKLRPISKLPIELLVVSTDVVWLIPTFILAVLSAIREGGIKDPLYQYGLFINTGAFAAAAGIGFFCSLLYGIDAILFLLRIVGKNK